MTASHYLDEFERDALKEIINIALGKAATELNDIINLYVFMNVPQLDLLKPAELEEFIDREVKPDTGFNLVEQYFVGKSKGLAYLMLPTKSGQQLLGLLGAEPRDTGTYGLDLLEQEALMEIGNIVIGVCVSRIAELVGDVVTYLPPRIISGSSYASDLPRDLFEGERYVILLKTVFHFEGKNIDGYMFLINSYESVVWLKKSIADYIAKHI